MNLKLIKRMIRIEYMDRFFNIFCKMNTDINPRQDVFNMHMHSDYEIYCFLAGNVKYIVEGTVYPLHKGDFILIRRSESHHICFLSESTYTRIVLNFTPTNPYDELTEKLMLPFNDRPLGKFNHYPSAHCSNSHLMHYMEQLCSCEDKHIRSDYLTVMLNEFALNFKTLKQHDNTSEDNLVTDIIRYVNLHLTDLLSLQHLSEKFFISKSQLNRNFKHIMGSTIWEYITGKRLLLAKKKIEEGANPTKIYIECGFNDYTAFYRAYCTKFGFSPSKTDTIPQ